MQDVFASLHAKKFANKWSSEMYSTRPILASGEGESGKTPAEDPTGPSTCSAEEPQRGWHSYKGQSQHITPYILRSKIFLQFSVQTKHKVPFFSLRKVKICQPHFLPNIKCHTVSIFTSVFAPCGTENTVGRTVFVFFFLSSLQLLNVLASSWI